MNIGGDTMTANEILKAIEKMDPIDKYELLDELFHKYFDKRDLPRTEYDDK
jgi:hypothetical protein